MSLKLKAKSQPFIGGLCFYKQPETGVELFANTFEKLADTIRRHRHANGIPVGLSFEDEIEAHCCKEKPDSCTDVDPNLPRPRHLSMADVLRGTKVMVQFLLAGSPVVEPEEAKRRAEICSCCRFNIQFSRPCAGLCGELKGIVSAIVGAKKTGFEEELKSCSICSCYTSASVWLPLDIQCGGVNEEMKIQFSHISSCWKQCS